MKYKTKKTLKTLALSVLGIGALVGVASGINALAEKQDTEFKTIIPIFEVGGLKDTDGKYEETKGSIYTKQAFECQGLEIELDFDNTIKYQVFYYEDDGDFISSTDVLLGNQDLVVPFGATHARLEITPNWSEMGEDYEDTKNQEIKWYEVAKYSTQMEVKVNKEQEHNLSSNLFVIDPTMDGKYWYGLSSHTELTPIEATSDTWSSSFVDCTEYKQLIVGIVNNGNGAEYNFENIYFGTDIDDSKLATVQAKCTDSNDVADIVYYTYDIPEGATRFAINYNARTINGTFVYGVK